MSISRDRPVVVIGAGPHGLSAVAHLRALGVPTRAFGVPLEFWTDAMPSGMVLRSMEPASSISDPRGELRLECWKHANGANFPYDAIPIGDFISYGRWFVENGVGDVDPRRVADVSPTREGFVVTLSDGDRIEAGGVVVGAGLAGHEAVPRAFRGLPPSLAAHTVGQTELGAFAGRAVAVIGSGQSAFESAALLHESGADVEVIARSRRIVWLGHGILGVDDELLVPSGSRPVKPHRETWRYRHGLYPHAAPTDVGGNVTSWVGAAPDVVRRIPPRLRDRLTAHCVRPAAAHWLPDRLRDVPITLDRSVISARRDGDRVVLRLDDGTARAVDFVLLGTGYRIDVRRYPFLGSRLLSKLRTRGGYPLLGPGMQSTVPGLYFTGAAAAHTFGPTMRFVVGTAYTGPTIARHAARLRLPRFRWAF